MEEIKVVKVYSAADRIEADTMVELLKANGIPAYRQAVGGGGYMDIYAGNSIYGEDIYVGSPDKAEAERIIGEVTAEADEEELDAAVTESERT